DNSAGSAGVESSGGSSGSVGMTSGGGSDGKAGSGGSTGAGGSMGAAGSTGAGGRSGAGGSAGSGGKSGAGGSGGSGAMHVVEACPSAGMGGPKPGAWENITPAQLNAANWCWPAWNTTCPGPGETSAAGKVSTYGTNAIAVDPNNTATVY